MSETRAPMHSRKQSLRKNLGLVTHVGLGHFVRIFRIPVSGFLILAQGRTGSSLLSDLLNSHPCIESASERLFTPVVFPEAYLIGHAARAATLGLLWGFKVKNYQLINALDGREQEFLSELQNRNWRFINLRRENFIDSALSTVVGLERGKFHYRQGEKTAFSPIDIDPDNFRNHLIGRMQQNEIDKKLFDGINSFEVVYERDLVKGGEPGRLKELQDFLGVPFHSLRSKYRKSETDHVSKYVRNWQDLRKVAVELGHGSLADRTFPLKTN